MILAYGGLLRAPGGFKSLSMAANVPIVVAEAIESIIMPGDPLILEGAEAVSRYHVAQAAGSPAQQVERCRLLGR